MRIHGINPEDVKKDDIEMDELVFIIMTLDAGSVLYRIGGDRFVELTDYRKNFLDHKK